MTTEQILKLVDAGYTRDEILKMDQPAQVSEAPAEPSETPVQAVSIEKQTATAPQSGNVTLSNEQLQQLIQGIAVKTASGSVDMPASIDDTLAARLNSLLKGEN